MRMDIFTILIIILFATAIVDLIVGVSNDAVNFLNAGFISGVQLISESCIDHLNNFHSLPFERILKASDEMKKWLSNYIVMVSEGTSSSSFKNADKITEQYDALVTLINKTVVQVISKSKKVMLVIESVCSK